MAGTIKSVRINGRAFKVTSDADISFSQGGFVHTDSQSFSDGTSEPITTVVPARLAGVPISTSDIADYNALADMQNKKGLPIIIETSTKSIEGTGFFIASEGLTESTQSDTVEIELRNQEPKWRVSAL